ALGPNPLPELTEKEAPCRNPGRNPRDAWIPTCLPPTDGPLCYRLQSSVQPAAVVGRFHIFHFMMAGKTLELGKFWPGRRGTLLGAPGQPFQTLTQGYRLPHGAVFATPLILRDAPMRRQYGSKRVLLNDMLRVTRRKQFVINITRFIPHMTRHTFFCPFDQIAGVVHTLFQQVLIFTINVILQPDACRPMARFTTDAIFELKLRTTRCLRRIHGM